MSVTGGIEAFEYLIYPRGLLWTTLHTAYALEIAFGIALESKAKHVSDSVYESSSPPDSQLSAYGM